MVEEEKAEEAAGLKQKVTAETAETTETAGAAGAAGARVTCRDP